MAGERVGPERRASGDVAGGRQAPRRRARVAGRPPAASPPTPGSPSSAARPWPTPRASPRRGTRCSAGSAGTCRPTGCSARRSSRSSSASGPTRRCRSRSGWSASAATGSPSCPPTTRAGCAPSCCPTSTGPVLVCAQAGEVNTRRLRPVRRDRRLAGGRGPAGCTSTAPSGCGRSPTRAAPTSCAGLDRADSWATDGHKWLNVTYDCGIAFVRRLADLRRTFAATAGLPPAERRVRGDAPHAPVVPAGPPGRGVGGAADARPGGASRSSSRKRATSPPRSPSSSRRRAHHPQRRRAQPGARPPRRRADHRGAHRRGPGRRSRSGAGRPSGTARRRCGSACRRGRPTSTTPRSPPRPSSTAPSAWAELPPDRGAPERRSSQGAQEPGAVRPATGRGRVDPRRRRTRGPCCPAAGRACRAGGVAACS